MSVISNVTFVGLLISGNCGFLSVPVLINLYLVTLLVNTQFSDYVKIRFISQLISVFQKLLKYFSGTTIPGFLSVFSPSNVPVILVL